MNLGHVSGSGYDGLSIRDGRLINQARDCKTGIQRMAEERKAVKRAEKIQTMSEAFMMGERMARLEESLENDMPSRAFRSR